MHGVQQRSNTMTFNTLKVVGKNGNDRNGVKIGALTEADNRSAGLVA